MTRFNHAPWALLAAAFTLFLAAPSGAAKVLPALSDVGAREIDRDAADLPTEIRPRPADMDVVDTALVFTNIGSIDRRILCVGFDKQGDPVGRVWLKLPALGLRYVLASDLSNGADFIGSTQCKSHSDVKGSAIFLGPGITDLSVENIRGRNRTGRILFHVVATY